MSLDHADILWEHMRKQALADLPDTEGTDAEGVDNGRRVAAPRCLRCGETVIGEQCRSCGFCIGCEGGCAA